MVILTARAVPLSIGNYPRVTQLTSLLPEHEQLQAWRDKQLIVAAHGKFKTKKAPTTAELQEVYAIRENNTRHAAELGTAIHDSINGSTVANLDTNPNAGDFSRNSFGELQAIGLLPQRIAIPGTDAAAKWLTKAWSAFFMDYGRDWQPVMQEQRLAVGLETSSGINTILTGAPDLVCYDGDGVLSLVDWKTSRALYPSYAVQAAIYVRMLQAHGVPVERGYIVRLSKTSPGNCEIGAVDLTCGALLEPLIDVHHAYYNNLWIADSDEYGN